jgi:hypothetical protein
MSQVDIFTFINSTLAIFIIFFCYYTILFCYLYLPLINTIKIALIRHFTVLQKITF